MMLAIVLAGCDRSPFDKVERGMDQAEQRQAAQDYRGAVSSYEQALDGTAKTAEAHFRIAVLYADKLNNTIGAVHHFRRYMELQPNGSHVRDAKLNLDRLELNLATKLAGGTLISHADAMRLKNENAELRRQLNARDNPPTVGGASTADKPAAREADRKPAPGTRTYQVKPGDTLASISRKFYKTKARAKDIQDANRIAVPDVTKLKTGQTLIIP